MDKIQNSEISCECKKIEWNKYNEQEHILTKCNSCYCKFIREEITYEEYENICILSRKNSGCKFKEICMVAT